MDKPTDVKGTIFKIKRFSIHDGPGIRTSVFLKGCPLNCIWCHSPEGISNDISIWHNRNMCIACGKCVEACPEKALELIKNPISYINIDRNLCKTTGECVKACPPNAMQFTGSITTVSEIMSEIEKDNAFYQSSGGGVTLTGGEPLYQPDFAIEILKVCKNRNIHTAIETCLYCEKDVLDHISEFIDFFIIDLKLFDSASHKNFTGKTNEIIKENFRNITTTGKDIIVRIPLIDNIINTEKNLIAIVNFVKRINNKIPIEKISYNPLTENNYTKLDIPFLIK
jgi:pyruvate formate lyase activating enzyme